MEGMNQRGAFSRETNMATHRPGCGGCRARKGKRPYQNRMASSTSERPHMAPSNPSTLQEEPGT